MKEISYSSEEPDVEEDFRDIDCHRILSIGGKFFLIKHMSFTSSNNKAPSVNLSQQIYPIKKSLLVVKLFRPFTTAFKPLFQLCYDLY